MISLIRPTNQHVLEPPVLVVLLEGLPFKHEAGFGSHGDLLCREVLHGPEVGHAQLYHV